MHYALLSVSFYSFLSYLTHTGYAPNFFSKQWLQCGVKLYLETSASIFFFCSAPVSCPILSSHKDDNNLFGIHIQSAESVSNSALQVSSKRHLSSSSTEPIMPHYEFSSALASKHWLVLLFLMPPHCGCDMSGVLLSYSVSFCVHIVF